MASANIMVYLSDKQYATYLKRKKEYNTVARESFLKAINTDAEGFIAAVEKKKKKN